MSIIYEALKKVEADTNDKAVKANCLLPKAAIIAPKPPKEINSAFYAVIAICVVLTVLIAIGAYFSNRNLQPLAAKGYLNEKKAVETKEETLESSKINFGKINAETPVVTPAGYSLQGIVYDENSPFAIINGKTLRKSDTIDDFIVSDIAPTVVTLKNSKDERELTLTF
ncbi:MAG: hypothetical protein M0R20_00920 [Candidatus Omnitrophica bacterium]|nr:hypothetical protein [Candidatus Omnitrophota bacterium]